MDDFQKNNLVHFHSLIHFEPSLTEIWIVDQSIDIDLVSHVDHLLLAGVEAESLHGIKSILTMNYTVSKLIINFYIVVYLKRPTVNFQIEN